MARSAAIALDKLEGWYDLEDAEQESVRSASEAAKEARKSETESSLAIGKNLVAIREIL